VSPPPEAQSSMRPSLGEAGSKPDPSPELPQVQEDPQKWSASGK